MYSFTNLPKRTFEVEHPLRSGELLHLMPPALRTVRALDSSQGFDGVVQTAAEILSRNKEGVTITAEELLEHLDYDQLRSFMTGFRRWLTDTRSSDPN